jgi:hypothetical protein
VQPQMSKSTHRLWFESRLWLKRSPRIYIPISRWRHGRTSGTTPQDLIHPQAVRRDTDLVIEAVEGSANTFSVLAFQAAQPGPLALAHHLHAPAQIAAASRWGIPTLVVIRHPRDVCASRVLRHSVSMSDALREYCGFYEETLQHRAELVLAGFESVTSNYGAVISRINERFQTAFVPFVHNEENVKGVFAEIDARYRLRYGNHGVAAVARPTNIREASKAVAAADYSAGAFGALRARAERIYDELVRTADA